VKLLLQILQGEGTPESITLPHVLVVRSSTAPPPGRRVAAPRRKRARR
jgi:hypothetical protein